MPEQCSALPTPESLSKAFESRKSHSNDDSDTDEPLGAQGFDRASFECSNQNEGVSDDAIEIYPDEDEGLGQGPKG